MDSDFLIIGAGVAGLRAAIELAEAGRVLVVAKESLHESSSEYAQGGIAVALSDDDEVALHEQDTLYAGDGLCDRAAVRTLVEEGPAAIQQLIAWGTEFDREGTRLAFTREGAHSRNRVLHAHGDSTGREIARALYHKAASLPNVEFRSYGTATDLLLGADGAAGALLCDSKLRRAVPVTARAVLLATGGLGHVFLNTTNPARCYGRWRGDGLPRRSRNRRYRIRAVPPHGAPPGRRTALPALRGTARAKADICAMRPENGS